MRIGRTMNEKVGGTEVDLLGDVESRLNAPALDLEEALQKAGFKNVEVTLGDPSSAPVVTVKDATIVVLPDEILEVYEEPLNDQSLPVFTTDSVADVVDYIIEFFGGPKTVMSEMTSSGSIAPMETVVGEPRRRPLPEELVTEGMEAGLAKLVQKIDQAKK